MGFDIALTWLKRGFRIRRAAWGENGSVRWVYLTPANRWGLNNASVANTGHVDSKLSPWVGMVAADYSFSPWTPNQLDLLAEDWQLMQTDLD